ncbi:hypothetical protein CPB84DRAFT_1763622 [Gymnopilus junonius]|uniref:Uncharacterized protein n=1 Tax=Gymnopilus junonius TaxID=109634 RepID=A0A9P5TRZ1_GYMJU|nr:hypothetical protein CPB84DRAFT_1763622 [Gymnopilus junonius]
MSGVVRIEATCLMDCCPQILRVCVVQPMRQVTVRRHHIQVANVDVGRAADCDSTTMAEGPVAGGGSVLVVMVRIVNGALHVRRVVMGHCCHRHPAFVVWMAKSDYWVISMSTRPGMPWQSWVKMSRFSHENRAGMDVVWVDFGYRQGIDHCRYK